MIGVDLFSGAGGLSLGATLAGINVVFAVEADLYAAKTWEINHPEAEVFANDIRLLEKIPIKLNVEPTILFGGPPCQGFSTSNQRTRNEANSNNWLFKEFLRLCKNEQPEWTLIENVKGLENTLGGSFIEQIIDGLEGIGYTTSYWVLNSADFGVPQVRNRLFIVGNRSGISVDKPKSKLSTSKWIPVRYALHDLPILENGNRVDVLPYRYKASNNYARSLRNDQKNVTANLVTRNSDDVIKRYDYIPQGGNWRDIPENLMLNYTDRSRCHTGIYHRLSEDFPSIVIGNYRKNMLVHPTQNRGLSVREAARIQSFPDSYKFYGSIGSQQQQVGNAVPPLLAKAVFDEILKYC